jgi:phosphatidylserine/phosphatidylglycerophosphate/cardiolipin synthase-like enzyme
VHVFDLDDHEDTPVYVHAKVAVIDGTWAGAGGANLNRRTWSRDSELSVAVFDETRDEREPTDPEPRRRRPRLRPQPTAGTAA